MKVEKVRVGVIGYGMRGSGVVKSILDNPGYDIAAIADTDEKALSEAGREEKLKGVEFFPDYGKITADDSIDAVFVMVPQFLHKRITVEALDAGKHVYCEKPMALSIGECDEMISAREKNGRVLMVGQQMRYHAHLNKMRSLVESGEIGRPIMMWLREFRNPFPKTMGWAFLKKNSGGLMVEKNCHHFDLFNWFSGSAPVTVFASGGQDVYPEPFGIASDILDNAWAIVDYENGMRAMLGVCMFAGMPSEREAGIGAHVRDIGVAGGEGMIRTEGFDLGRNLETRYSSSKNSVIHNIATKGNFPTAYNRGGNEGILTRFLECISRNEQPEASGEIGKLALAVSLAAEKSAGEKRPVLLSEILV